MTRQPLENIDPLQIFMHALGFHVAEDVLGKLTAGSNVQLGAQVVQANMALSALTTELFLKCLVCIETTLTPQGHHLSELFKQLTLETRRKIIHLWDAHIVPVRESHWKLVDGSIPGTGEKLKRDLPSALRAADYAFERTRYSYEPNGRHYSFNIGDMPRVLCRIILEMKPEWDNLGRAVTKVADAPNPQK